MRLGVCDLARAVFALLLCWLAILAAAQERPATLEVPDKFNLDMKTAARLRPDLLAQSTVAAGRYALGSRTFQKLVEQVDVSRNVNRSWELRIIGDGLLNAFSSPDGTIYVESGLADLAGQSAGLWAAILSHEIAHVVRRDWARRYLYEESLRSGSGGLIVLGDPGLPSAAWADSHKASEDLARFCRQLELDADLKSLVLMARRISPRLCARAPSPVARSKYRQDSVFHPCHAPLLGRTGSRAGSCLRRRQHRVRAPMARMVCFARRKSSDSGLRRQAQCEENGRQEMGDSSSHALPQSGGGGGSCAANLGSCGCVRIGRRTGCVRRFCIER